MTLHKSECLTFILGEAIALLRGDMLLDEEPVRDRLLLPHVNIVAGECFSKLATQMVADTPMEMWSFESHPHDNAGTSSFTSSGELVHTPQYLRCKRPTVASLA